MSGKHSPTEEIIGVLRDTFGPMLKKREKFSWPFARAGS